MSVPCDNAPSCVERDCWRRARKPHTCCACREPIPAGHRYHYSFQLFEGNAHGWKHCARCWEIYTHLCDVVPSDDEWPDIELNCGHTYAEIHEEPPPPEIAELAFVTPEEMQRRVAARRGSR